MSAFRGKADMTVCGNPHSRSLLGVKRTCLVALHESASDPKQTCAPLPMNEFKRLRWSRGGDETTRVNIVGSRERGVAARRARAAAQREETDRRTDRLFRERPGSTGPRRGVPRGAPERRVDGGVQWQIAVHKGSALHS